MAPLVIPHVKVPWKLPVSVKPPTSYPSEKHIRRLSRISLVPQGNLAILDKMFPNTEGDMLDMHSRHGNFMTRHIR
jgi:hypothetical protein